MKFLVRFVILTAVCIYFNVYYINLVEKLKRKGDTILDAIFLVNVKLDDCCTVKEYIFSVIGYAIDLNIVLLTITLPLIFLVKVIFLIIKLLN